MVFSTIEFHKKLEVKPISITYSIGMINFIGGLIYLGQEARGGSLVSLQIT
jgi:hypothetical protein